MSNLDKVYDFIKDNHVFYYSTIDNGRPRTRPFGFIMKHNDHIYLGMGDYKDCFKQTIENPNICVVSSGKGTWLRLNATAVHDTSEAAKAQAFEGSEFLQKKYNEETGLSLGLVRLENCVAEFINNDGIAEVLEF